MNYVIKDYRVSYLEGDKELAAATFPLVEGREKLININSTFVDPALRGKGVGGKLMEMIVEKSEKEGLKILPTCPFATKWFESHGEYHHLLRSSLGK